MGFERIKSGIESMDKLLDNIRLGDNVVMQVTCLEEFRRISKSLVKQAILDGRNINYIRFSEHEPILEPQEGLKIYTLTPASGFELFTIQVHEIIENEGYGAFYVFDCLSDLQVAWSTDLMMGNFFCVTCPYLSELDTVAYFPVLRGHHDYLTIARIQEQRKYCWKSTQASRKHICIRSRSGTDTQQKCIFLISLMPKVNLNP